MTFEPWMWAPIIGGTYLAVSAVVGDLFPFSRYDMYSSAVLREEGAVPLFLVEGEPARLDEYEAFFDIDPQGLYPRGYPCSLEWMIHEAKRYIETHRADEPQELSVAWGFRVLSVDDDGGLHERYSIVQEGSARRRR